MLVLRAHSEISITEIMELEDEDEPIDDAAGPSKKCKVILLFLLLTCVCVCVCVCVCDR